MIDMASYVYARSNNILSTLPYIEYQRPNNPSLIYKYVSRTHLNNLLTLERSFATARNLTFYTDGSLTGLGSLSIRMGLAWLQTNPISPVVSYSSAFVTSFPSSSAAELGAIFTAGLVAPQYCRIKIYTDSQSVIQQFNKFKSIRCFSPSIRPLLKINNYPLWFSLFEVIDEQNLSLILHKVKGHSGDLYNEKVDQLAKNCLDSAALTFSLSNLKQYYYRYNGMCITVPIRPFIKDITQSIIYNKFQQLPVINKHHQL